jgi:hypothetical protein
MKISTIMLFSLSSEARSGELGPKISFRKNVYLRFYNEPVEMLLLQNVFGFEGSKNSNHEQFP